MAQEAWRPVLGAGDPDEAPSPTLQAAWQLGLQAEWLSRSWQLCPLTPAALLSGRIPAARANSWGLANHASES